MKKRKKALVVASLALAIYLAPINTAQAHDIGR